MDEKLGIRFQKINNFAFLFEKGSQNLFAAGFDRI